MRPGFWKERKKLIITMAFIGIIGGGFMEWFKANYMIGIDEQEVKCIPDVDYVIGDLNDRVLVRDGLFVVKSSGLEPLIADGTLLVKFLRAVPGDTVKVSEEGVFVNDHKVAEGGLPMAHRFNKGPEEFYGERVLGEDEHWIMGTTAESFDSRYWGSVSYEQVQARAYPIL